MSKSKFTNFPNLLFSVFSFGNGKNLREPTLQNLSSEKINRKLVKSPSVSLRVSPTPYALESIFKTSLTSMMFFKKVLQFTSFQIMMYYLDVFSSPWSHGGVQQGADRENFQTDLYLRIHSTKMSVSYVQCLCDLIYASNTDS